MCGVERTLVVGDERAERGEGGLGRDVVAAAVVERADLVVLHERDAAARLVLVAHAQREVPRVGTGSDEVSAARVARHEQQAVRVAPADVEPAVLRLDFAVIDNHVVGRDVAILLCLQVSRVPPVTVGRLCEQHSIAFTEREVVCGLRVEREERAQEHCVRQRRRRRRGRWRRD